MNNTSRYGTDGKKRKNFLPATLWVVVVSIFFQYTLFVKKESNVRSKTAIEETSIAEFSKGDPVYVIKFPPKAEFLYSPRETVKRAKSLIGRTDYNMVFNNCEHFAYWCKTGKHESSQVQDVCEQLFNKRFELDELKDEITETAFLAVQDFTNAVGEKLEDLMERLAGVPRPD